MADALDPGHLFGHVQDAYQFEVPKFLAPETEGRILIPQPFGTLDLSDPHHPKPASGFCISKLMVLELVAAVIVAVIFIRIAALLSSGKPPRGKFWNFFESILLFIRDSAVRPAIGHHDADRFLPLIWTLFFFILTCNLLGMLPWAGSPTGSLSVTATLALVAILSTIGAGMLKLGFFGFWKSQVPHMDLPGPIAVALVPMIFGIEFMGLFIKHGVLALRLFVNMMAGHLVLAVILAFTAATAESLLWYGVMPASVLGATALSLLELFVAFLQAYIFTFLASLFIGMAVHPH